MRFSAYSSSNAKPVAIMPSGTSPYYAFGSSITEMQYSNDTAKGYRFGFNNQEKDDEVVGGGDYYAFEFRVHDARLGRFLSIDPLSKDYPWNSPYAFSENRVIDSKELEGAESINATKYRGNVLVLTMADPASSLQFNRTTAIGTTTIRPGDAGFDISQEKLLLSFGSQTQWTGNNGGTGFSSPTNSTGNSHRPILWKSYSDGNIPNNVINTNTIQDANVNILIGTSPLAVKIAADGGFVAASLNASVAAANATVGVINPILNAPGPINIANVPNPDNPAQNIAINQNSVTAGNSTVLAVGNYVVNLNGNPADLAEINGAAALINANALAAGIVVTVNTNINAANPAGTINYTVAHDQTVQINTVTNTNTTATNTSTGQNIPQGSGGG